VRVSGLRVCVASFGASRVSVNVETLHWIMIDAAAAAASRIYYYYAVVIACSVHHRCARVDVLIITEGMSH